MTTIRTLSIAVLAALLTACASNEALRGDWSVFEDAENPTNAIQTLLKMNRDLDKPTFNLDRVLVLRMTIDGKRLEVTSLAPTSIISEPNRGNLTLFNMGDRKSLVLFTRDGKNIRAYRKEIPLDQIKPGMSLRFPVAEDPGNIVLKEITFDRLISPE